MSIKQILFGLIFSLCIQLAAQDTHYWTHDFGNRTALLSGAILGETSDNTMVYYNPGALGFLTENSISVNATAYNTENIKIYNAAGQKATLKSNQLGSVPLFAGGMINLKNSKWKLGYGFMTPIDFNFKGIARVDGDFDIIDNTESPGDEELVGETSLTTKASDILFALGAGRIINDHLSFGFTNLFYVRSSNYQRNYSSYVFLNDANNTLVASKLTQHVQYYNIRYALKLGLTYKKDKLNLGLTLTTPSLNIGGNGTVASDIVATNVKINSGDRISGIATDRQSELKTTYKSPFSIAGGINYDFTRSSLGIAAQYFAGIDEYTIMNPVADTYVRPDNLAPNITSDTFLSTPVSATSVFNVAIGYEYELNSKYSILASMRNNMSSFDPSVKENKGIVTHLSSWNIVHFVSGVIINRENSSLSLGLLYALASTQNYHQNGNLSNPDEINILEGATNITDAKYNSLGFLLGYTYHFKKFR
ncbi:hypothetical protein [Tamlana sp. I1]|uniref:hypothetical protein n=1 Tax=Tamlana sp. I1 TaxID=2762061 RepID=UPI00188F46BD|nr:hypothetical protein [Tamlana sp. I1]